MDRRELEMAECLISDHLASGVEGTLGIWRVLYRSTPHLCLRSEDIERKTARARASSFWECRDEVIQAHPWRGRLV